MSFIVSNCSNFLYYFYLFPLFSKSLQKTTKSQVQKADPKSAFFIATLILFMMIVLTTEDYSTILNTKTLCTRNYFISYLTIGVSAKVRTHLNLYVNKLPLMTVRPFSERDGGFLVSFATNK
jgi:hypothetical protein